MGFKYYPNNNDLHVSEDLVENDFLFVCKSCHHKLNLRQSTSTPHSTHTAHTHEIHTTHTAHPHETHKVMRHGNDNIENPHHIQENKLRQQTAEKLDREQENKRFETNSKLTKMKPNFLDFELQKLSAMIGIRDYSRQGRYVSKMKTSGTSDENKIQLLFNTIEDFVANNRKIIKNSRKSYIDKFSTILHSIESPEKIHEYVPALPESYMNILGSVIVSQLDESFFELMNLRKTSSKKFNIEIRCIKEFHYHEIHGGEWIKNETPLELAVRSKRPEYVQSLVDAGVNTSAMTEQKVDEIYDYKWPSGVDTKPTLLRCFDNNKGKQSAADNAKVLFAKKNEIRKILGLALKSRI